MSEQPSSEPVRRWFVLFSGGEVPEVDRSLGHHHGADERDGPQRTARDAWVRGRFLRLQGLQQMSEATPTKDGRSWWTITVSGYGSFAYFGTRVEADTMRKDKADWEGGTGRKRAATEAEADVERRNLQWRHANGYPLDERELQASES